MKVIKENHLRIVIFAAVKNCSILHGRVFVLIIFNNTFNKNDDDNNYNNRIWNFKIMLLSFGFFNLFHS